ncbi:hypothetical protein F5Y14DRAFT_275791 [Nemania sp. NC0429]|nr:hypothetical protein F5Y14DRAFT_275791 [Nemania sp. NC0429]
MVPPGHPTARELTNRIFPGLVPLWPFLHFLLSPFTGSIIRTPLLPARKSSRHTHQLRPPASLQHRLTRLPTSRQGLHHPTSLPLHLKQPTSTWSVPSQTSPTKGTIGPRTTGNRPRSRVRPFPLLPTSTRRGRQDKTRTTRKRRERDKRQETRDQRESKNHSPPQHTQDSHNPYSARLYAVAVVNQVQYQPRPSPVPAAGNSPLHSYLLPTSFPCPPFPPPSVSSFLCRGRITTIPLSTPATLELVVGSTSVTNYFLS